MGGARLSGVHNCRRFLDRALAPEVMFPSPQRLKPAHFQILTAPLKRCSTLSTQGETALEIAMAAAVMLAYYPDFGTCCHRVMPASRDKIMVPFLVRRGNALGQAPTVVL